MGIAKRAAASGEAIVDRVLCVAGAVAFSQAPEFMQKYLLVLAGRLGEARLAVADIEGKAQLAGKTVAEYIAYFNANADHIIASGGDLMQNTVARMNDYAASYESLKNASMLGKPFAFLAHLDAQIAKDAWKDFTPAVPMTVEGLVYALVGIAVILGLYYGCVRAPVLYCWRKYKERKAAKAAAPAVPAEPPVEPPATPPAEPPATPPAEPPATPPAAPAAPAEPPAAAQ